MKNISLKSRVFYGWWIVGAIFLISGYISGIVTFGFTAFIEPITKEFNWSYTQISIAASIRGLESSLLTPLVGVLIDRWGPRKLVAIGTAITGLGLLALSGTTSLVMLYGAFILISIGVSTSSAMILTTVVGHWFRKKLSLAISIAVCGSAFGGLLVPLMTRVIDTLEWRTAMAIFGIAAWVIILPLSLLLRHKPEQYGYLPYGDIDGKPVSVNEPLLPTNVIKSVGVKQALKDRSFWQISLGSLCLGLAAAAIVTHVMPYLSSVSIPRSTSSLVVSGIALTGILGRLSFGWLGDRFDKRWMTALGFVMSIFGLLLFSYITTSRMWLLIPFVILFGAGWGGCIPLLPALLVGYFGRIQLGTILGFSMGVVMLGNVIGPPLAGWVFDTFGSYRGAWLSFTGLVAIGTISVITMPSVDRAS